MNCRSNMRNNFRRNENSNERQENQKEHIEKFNEIFIKAKGIVSSKNWVEKKNDDTSRNKLK